MAGLVAATHYSWKDGNLALFGSDEEKAVKKEKAEQEPAWAPVKSINSTTLMVWRVKNFQLEVVPPEDVGKFFSGDSYVVLKVEKVGNQLLYDVHFWMGKDSTKDEYGTAAYKAVELDTFLDGNAVEHREVDGFESELFKSYFTELQKLSGGYASGFNKVKPEEFKPRLMVCHGMDRNHVELTEVTFSKRSVNTEDVFILDLGNKAYQWNGQKATKDEKYRGNMFLQHVATERIGRCTTVVVDESDREGTIEFLSHLPDAPVQEDKPAPPPPFKKAVYKVSDASGKLETMLVCEGSLPRNVLTPDDVFILDTGLSLFAYIGEKCTWNEKLNALAYAHNYLKTTTHPLIPITVISEKRPSKELEKILE
ncbi:unnamed protein product [Calicophoron daubneyi]|uniref:Gelsolin-like domain-containing protein n=1 Tax=Calicophoron daubneyi TaxID=300641 RepID=A0AAV2T567_CALDB